MTNLVISTETERPPATDSTGSLSKNDSLFFLATSITPWSGDWALTGARFVAALDITGRDELDAERLGATFAALPGVAVNAILGLTLYAMRGVASEAMPGPGLGGAGPDGVAVEEEDTNAG